VLHYKSLKKGDKKSSEGVPGFSLLWPDGAKLSYRVSILTASLNNQRKSILTAQKLLIRLTSYVHVSVRSSQRCR
jgi:hypothetical protein